MAMNTSYLNTAKSPAGTSDMSQLAGSMSTFVAIDNAGTLNQTGILTMGAALNSASALSVGALVCTTITPSGAINSKSAISGAAGLFTTITGTSIICTTIAPSGAINSASAISGSTGAFTTITGTTITASSGLSVPSASKFYPASYTSTSADSSTMADGQMSIMSVSTGSCILAVRSGHTVYQFIADKAQL